MEKEVWRDVVGFEEFFKVSNYGFVFSKRTNKILKQHKAKSGYVTIATKIGGVKGRNYCFKVHRLVAEAFLGVCDGVRIQVNHKDGDKSNNSVSNLDWVTARENSQHALQTGLISCEARVNRIKWQRKLTDSQVLFIRENYKPHNSEFSARALSRYFGVSHKTILEVVNGISYLDIKSSGGIS